VEEPTAPRGVPVNWVNGGDFVQVSAEMTKALDGDFIAAGVAGRIRFVARLVTPDEDGMCWVDAPAQKIADDMGLSVKQVRRALTVLEDHGYIVRSNRGNSWDRTLSVALVYQHQADVESPASAL
jgi:DNA-binding transcriptional ArsR family regulator